MRVAIALLFLSSSVVVAQNLSSPPVPKHLTVATSASGTTVRPGGKVSLFVDVAPNRGIHVYAPGAKDYMPIALTVGPQKSATVGKTMYPKSELLFFAPLKETVPVYQKPFRLTREVTIERLAKAGTLRLEGTVDYQACDDKVCFKPEAVPVSWTIAVR